MFQFAPKGNAVSQTRKILVAVLPLIFLSSTVFAVDTSNMTIDQRLKRLEAAMDNNSMVDIFLKLENLQKEVESMRGELELISHDFRGIKKQQKDLYLDLDQRIQETNQAIADVAAQASSMVSGGGFGSSSALGSAGEESEVGMDEQRAYQDAFNFLKNSEYDKAVAAFQSFLKTFPQGAYADNAQYWLGEVFYVTKDYQKAADAFTDVVNKYPKSAKLADAHLKIGFSFYELKNYSRAEQSLKLVSEKYPDTTAARLAQKRLQQMRVEGKS